MATDAGPGGRLSVTEAAAGLFLGVLAFAALRNAQAGTLGLWLSQKFLNRGEPAPGSTAPPITAATGGSTILPTAGGGQFGDPMPSGTLISVWGDPRDGGARRHEGVDIGAPRGTPVQSVGNGVVKYATTTGRCGLGVSIEHGDGWRSLYCHLDTATVAAGETVRRGQTIGTNGNSGNARTTTPHVHFELRRNKQPVNPQALIGR